MAMPWTWTAPDFLEYLADDPETNMIALYIEGTRNARDA